MIIPAVTIQKTQARALLGSGSKRVELSSRPRLVASVAKQGPAGPKGDAGQTHNHTQSTPASTWVVNHNLGFRPAVEVYTDGGGSRFVEHAAISLNQTEIRFLSAKTGTAHFS